MRWGGNTGETCSPSPVGFKRSLPRKGVPWELARRPVSIDVLPTLEGTTLSGREVHLPQDLPAGPVVLVLGFAHGARHDVGGWKVALAAKGIPYLSLPTSAQDLSREDMAEVARAMRTRTPREAWEGILQIHQGGETLLRAFDWRPDVFAKVLRLGPGGAILARHDAGPFTEAALAKLLR